MSEYERQKIEYESALNAAKDKWFYAREKSVERSPNSEFIYAGGFRMAWEQMQAENAALKKVAEACQTALLDYDLTGLISGDYFEAACVALREAGYKEQG